MKYITLYENFKEDFSIDYDAMVEVCVNVFGDKETGKYEADWYIDTLEDLYSKGGKVYRMLFLENINDLDKDNLGVSWTLDEGCFSRIYGNIVGEHNDEEAYIITALVPPKFVNISQSIECFMELPQESEVNLKDNPTNIKIEKYNK